MKQYLAQIQFKIPTNEWANASILTGGSRYLNSQEEAEKAIERAIKQYNKGARIEREDIGGGIGIIMVMDEETAERFNVVKARIKVREVSEWQEI